ncbi:MAG: hypothetical protein AABX00_00355 [Nanoarchaeota archaeon]
MACDQLDTPQEAVPVAIKNLSGQEKVFKDQKAQDRFEYLVRTRNKVWAIVKFK